LVRMHEHKSHPYQAPFAETPGSLLLAKYLGTYQLTLLHKESRNNRLVG
jgi:hypothetical protein